MAAVPATKEVRASTLGHAITVDGRKVLIIAEGPDINPITKLRARANHWRWNRARRHLV